MDPDEVAHFEPPHSDLFNFFFFGCVSISYCEIHIPDMYWYETVVSQLDSATSLNSIMICRLLKCISEKSVSSKKNPTSSILDRNSIARAIAF